MYFRNIASLTVVICCLASAVLGQDNKEQKTETSDMPIYIGIVVDCSGSQRTVLDRTFQAVKQIAESLREKDQAFLVRFIDSGKISVIQELTNKKEEIEDSSDSLYIEGGQSAIIDAVDHSAKYLVENSADGSVVRILIVITDGEDGTSGKKIDEVVPFLKEKQIKVFAIGISDLKVSTKLFDRLTKETGGKTFIPRTSAEVSNAVIDIVKSLRPASAQVK
jgi:uncharacterized protein with von Willebrand factor type A (vWA) domain